jgi:DNA topoisomerase-1
MSSAIYDTVAVNVTGKSQSHEYLLRATGAKIKFPGFLVVYEESKSEGQSQNGDEIQIPLDLIREGQPQQLVRLIPEQHFTQPPSRFSEASLVRALEENAIGRPSTYAPIIGTLQQRGYVIRDNKRLVPTETGEIVNDLLADYFPNILDVGFTARMEQDLDRIASGEQPWKDVVQEFYSPFSKQVAHAKDVMPEVKVEPELIGRNCPESGHELIVRWGRYGKFISCSGFPECRYTEPWLEAIGVKCPKDGGEVVERRTKRGRVFYGCSNYPSCDFTSWKRPLSIPCPNCGEMLVIPNKNYAQCIACEKRFELQEIQPLQVKE